MTETVKVMGTLPDGSTRVIGEIPIPPEMKQKDIVRNYFGEPSENEDDWDDATSCLWALRDYHNWLVKQGWTPPPVDFTPVG